MTKREMAKEFAGFIEANPEVFAGRDKTKLIDYLRTVGSSFSKYGDSAEPYQVFCVNFLIEHGVDIFEGVKRIPSFLFQLIDIRIHERFRLPESLDLTSVENIGAYAFECVDSIKSVKFSKALKSIHGRAFMYCVNLERVEYEGTMEEWKNLPISATTFFDTAVQHIQCSDGALPLQNITRIGY